MYAYGTPPSPVRLSPCRCMGSDAVTRTTGVKSRSDMLSTHGKLCSFSRDTQTHRSGFVSLLANASRTSVS